MLRSRSPDPLTLAIAPPANETAQQRIAREAEEERKRQISASIDAEIKAEKAALKKRGKQIKVLVLGQSNSGMFALSSFGMNVKLIRRVSDSQENPRPLKVCCLQLCDGFLI